MREMFERWLVSALISYVLKQVKQFQQDVNWKQVQEDASKAIRELIPGEWIDDEAEGLAVTVIATCEHALSNENRLKTILNDLAEDAEDGHVDYAAAAVSLRSYLVKSWEAVQANLEGPSNGSKDRAYAYIEKFQPLA